MTKAPWKSKNLITRLRWWGFKFCGKGDQENLASDVMCDAADRIETLEAVLREIVELTEVTGKGGYLLGFTPADIARKALEGKDAE